MTALTDTPPPGPDPRRAPLLRRPLGWRAVSFLAVNLLVFLAVNAFWRYVSTGSWWDVSPAAYRHDLATPLGTALRTPLGVIQRPWMILVTAGLLGGMVFVPLIVSVFYPLRVAAGFIAVVALVGHCPVMAGALAAGCLLTARTPLRSEVPFIAILIGLLPVALYMYFFAFAGTNLATMKPIARLLFGVPFLGAFALAVLGSAIVLAMAEWTGYRPGVVWPVLVALLAIPVTFFYLKVGADELRYAVIVQSLGPGDTLFPEELLGAWKDRTASQGLSPQTLGEEIEGELDARRRRLIKRCEDFLERYPKSPRAPEVLWVQAQSYSARLLRSRLARGVIEFGAAWPARESESCWQRLADEYPQTPPATLARWRLAQLAVQKGDLELASRLAKPVAEALTVVANNLSSSRGPFGEPKPDVPPVDYYEGAASDARTLVYLLKHNQNNLADLKEYLLCNPYETDDLRRRLELRNKLDLPDKPHPASATHPATATAPASQPASRP